MKSLKSLMENRVRILQGDITTLDCEALVNAANSSLLGGGGVDGAIHRAGGPEILAECRILRKERFPDGLPPGEVAATTAGNMQAKYVFHTVGPIWHGGTAGEEEILARAYQNSLDLAAELKIQSIAFPAISTGIYGFPFQKAALIVKKVLETKLDASEYPREVLLCFFSTNDRDQFIKINGLNR
jgi:O-acetyl-ADP-ribose deacetylase (regulator of RNase III)